MVPLFIPDIALRRVSDITPEMLAERGVKALILDIDNTLTAHFDKELDKTALKWLEMMKKSGVSITLVSNNRKKRVMGFAAQLGLPYVYSAMKPLPRAFQKTSRNLGLPAMSIAVVGDQIFTDILGGNLFGALTVLVEPIKEEDGAFFRIKRKAEALVLGSKKHI